MVYTKKSEEAKKSAFEKYREGLRAAAAALKLYLQGTVIRGTESWWTPSKMKSARKRFTKKRFDYRKAKAKRLMQKESRRANRK